MRMDRAAQHIGSGGMYRPLPAAAPVHSKSQMTRGVDNMLLLPSRKLLQNGPSAPQTFEEADSALFVVLTVCGGIGLLILISFGVFWCVYTSKRRSRFPSSDDGDSAVTDPDEQLTDDDKLGASYMQSDVQRPPGYGSDSGRKLARSAQLYHYEKQKRELLALEQSSPNEIDTPPHGTPPPTYANYLSSASSKSRSASNREDGNSTVNANGFGTMSVTSANSSRQAKLSAHDNEDEEFAVYEYPGLVTTVGQIEIDNPLYRSSDIGANDSTDVDLLGTTDDVDSSSKLALGQDIIDPNSPFGTMPVHIVRQQPDLLASVGSEASGHSSATDGSHKSKHRSKRTTTSSPTARQGSSSDSTQP